jgi:hypothetical protein
LIFDATDDDTPVGDLPEHEQVVFALIAAGDAGAPDPHAGNAAGSKRAQSPNRATLAAHGSLRAHQPSALGTPAAMYRGEFRRESKTAYTKTIERLDFQGATAAKVDELEPKD